MSNLQTRDRRLTPAGHARVVERLRQFKAQLDPNRKCKVPGCSTPVGPRNLGRWCPRHHRRIQFVGHPWIERPVGSERRAAREAVARYLAGMSEVEAASFQVRMQAAIRTLYEPPSNALPPAKARSIGPTLTLRGKAQIILAHLNKREGFDRTATRLLIEAMSLECWAAAYWGDSRKTLPRFLNTTLGQTSTRLARLYEKKTRLTNRGELEVIERWVPTDPARAAVGARITSALRMILPRYWVTDQIITDTITEATKLSSTHQHGEHRR
jgi:hypothetical protein